MPKKVEKELSRSLIMVFNDREDRKKAAEVIEKRRPTDDPASNRKIMLSFYQKLLLP
jgi:hypothetical protein